MRNATIHMRRLAALALCVGAVAPVASAEAAPKVQKARFKATIEGVQTNAWSSSHEGSGGCDPTTKGEGTEVARFRSRTITVEATYLKGLSNPVLRPLGGDQRDIYRPLRAKVTRKSKISVSPVPLKCQGVGGGGKGQDCGTRSATGKFYLNYAFRMKDRLQLDGGNNGDSPFKSCGGGMFGFPLLLKEKSSGAPITAKLPKKELFNRKLGKIITIARGKKITQGAETRDEATIRWELTLVRIGRKK